MDAMRDAGRAAPFGRRRDDLAPDDAVIDADFITLSPGIASPTDAGGTQPAEAARPPAARASATRPGMALFADDQPAPPRRDDRVAFYGFSGLLVLLSFWVAGGHVLSHGTAAGSRPALALEQVAWRVEGAARGPALHVDGVLRNGAGAPVALSPVTVTVRTAQGRTTRFRINPGAGSLPAGASLAISGVLDLTVTGAVPARGSALDRAAPAIETVTVDLVR